MLVSMKYPCVPPGPTEFETPVIDIDQKGVVIMPGLSSTVTRLANMSAIHFKHLRLLFGDLPLPAELFGDLIW